MKSLIEKFYTSFAALNAEEMVNCYHKQVTFKDPAFGELVGDDAGDMWRMLCKSQQGRVFDLNYWGIESDGVTGKAHWEAKYFFSQTGNKVHNKIVASFEFRDGLIVNHVDQFNLYRWAAQALGWKGMLVGWTPFFQKQMQVKANHLLKKYQAKK